MKIPQVFTLILFLAICPKKKSLIMFDYQGIFLNYSFDFQ